MANTNLQKTIGLQRQLANDGDVLNQGLEELYVSNGYLNSLTFASNAYISAVDLTKASNTYVNTQLSTRASNAYLQTELGSKASNTYVNTELNTKTSNAYITSVIGLRATNTYVNAELATKSSNVYVSAVDASKATNTYVNTQLSTKPSNTYVATVDATKASNTYVNTELGLKLDSSSYTAADVLTKIKTVDGTTSGLDADLLDGLEGTAYASNTYMHSYIDVEITALVNAAPAALDTLNELAAALGDDANFSTTVTNSLATKASNTYVNTELLAKASNAYVNTQLASVPSNTYIQSELDLKATNTYVNTELAAKATNTYVNTELGTKAGNAYLNATFTSNTYVQNQLGTKLDATSYTAADVLTKVKTVDGPTSGLDADLLDGLHSSSFASNVYLQSQLGGASVSNTYVTQNFTSNAYIQSIVASIDQTNFDAGVSGNNFTHSSVDVTYSEVYVNGIRLASDDFTHTSNTVNILFALESDDDITVIRHTAGAPNAGTNVSNTYLQATFNAGADVSNTYMQSGTTLLIKDSSGSTLKTIKSVP